MHITHHATYCILYYWECTNSYWFWCAGCLVSVVRTCLCSQHFFTHTCLGRVSCPVVVLCWRSVQPRPQLVCWFRIIMFFTINSLSANAKSQQMRVRSIFGDKQQSSVIFIFYQFDIIVDVVFRQRPYISAGRSDVRISKGSHPLWIQDAALAMMTEYLWFTARVMMETNENDSRARVVACCFVFDTCNWYRSPFWNEYD